MMTVAKDNLKRQANEKNALNKENFENEKQEVINKI